MSPKLRHTEVARTEPSRRAATLVGGVLAVAAAAGLVALAGHQPTSTPSGPASVSGYGLRSFAAWVCILLIVLGYLSTLVNGRRWTVAEQVQRISNFTAVRATLPDNQMPRRASRGNTPPLTIELGAPRWRRPALGRLGTSGDRNVVGLPPMQMAYLRLFDNIPRSRTFLQGAWREFGYVYLLRSAASVTAAEFRQLRRDPAGSLLSNLQDLRRELDRPRPLQPPGLRTFRQLSPFPVRTWDRYGGFPPVALLCHGTFWQAAVDALLSHVDVVVLDLSGFKHHQGTGWEISRVLDRFPIERVLFLADPRSDIAFLERALHEAWEQMAPDSPNARGGPRSAHLVRTDDLRRTVHVDPQGQELRRETRLVARRSQTRRLAYWLQEYAQHAPQPPRRPPAAVSAAPVRSAEVAVALPPIPVVTAARVVASVVTLALVGLLGVAAPSLDDAQLLRWPPSTGFASPTPPSGPTPSVTEKTTVAVPDMVGGSKKKAVKRLRAAGLREQVVARASSAKSGTVVGQAPAPGTRLPAASVVRLEVSSGLKKRKVPAVSGRTLGRAEKVLRERGLRLGEIQRELSARREGIVLRSSPRAGKRVVVGTAVDLRVASGENVVEDMRGRPWREAEDELKKAGFQVEVVYEASSGEEPGRVLAQEPVDVRLRVKGTVTLTVPSSPPTPSPTPEPSPTPTG